MGFFDFLTGDDDSDIQSTYFALMHLVASLDGEVSSDEEGYIGNYLGSLNLSESQTEKLQKKLNNLSPSDAMENANKLTQKEKLELIDHMIDVAKSDGEIAENEAVFITGFTETLGFSREILKDSGINTFHAISQEDDSEEEINFDGTQDFESVLEAISPQWNNILNIRAKNRKKQINYSPNKDIPEFLNDKLKFTVWKSAEGHCEEYMVRYENGDMDVEGIYYRLDVYHRLILEFENYYRIQQSKEKKIADEVENKFLALIESLIGAELTLLKMKKNGDEIDFNRVFQSSTTHRYIKEGDTYLRPNYRVVKDPELGEEDRKSKGKLDKKGEYSYYSGYLFNGIIFSNSRRLYYRFGLKHADEEYKNPNIGSEFSINFNGRKISEIDGFENHVEVFTKEILRASGIETKDI